MSFREHTVLIRGGKCYLEYLIKTILPCSCNTIWHYYMDALKDEIEKTDSKNLWWGILYNEKQACILETVIWHQKVDGNMDYYKWAVTKVAPRVITDCLLQNSKMNMSFEEVLLAYELRIGKKDAKEKASQRFKNRIHCQMDDLCGDDKELYCQFIINAWRELKKNKRMRGGYSVSQIIAYRELYYKCEESIEHILRDLHLQGVDTMEVAFDGNMDIIEEETTKGRP